MRRLITYFNALFLGMILGMIYVAIFHARPAAHSLTQDGERAPSVLPITAAAMQFPTTFIIVRPMSISVSTPRIRRIGAVGKWTALAVASRTTSDALGTPAIPLLAAISTRTTASSRPNVR